MADLKVETDRFRIWASTFPENDRNGEWEVEYGAWPQLYSALFEFLNLKPLDKWSPREMEDVLYVMARDNECEHVASELRRTRPELLVPLAQASLDVGERDNRWQLANEMGWLGRIGGPEEELLVTLTKNDDEYVRRRALQSLARISSSATETLALAEWNRADRDQEWARLNVLWCLHQIGSPLLESFLADAESDSRKYLSNYARRVRNGDLEE